MDILFILVPKTLLGIEMITYIFIFSGLLKEFIFLLFVSGRGRGEKDEKKIGRIISIGTRGWC